MKLEYDTEAFFIVPETEFEKHILKTEWFGANLYIGEVDEKENGDEESHIFLSLNRTSENQ